MKPTISQPNLTIDALINCKYHVSKIFWRLELADICVNERFNYNTANIQTWAIKLPSPRSMLYSNLDCLAPSGAFFNFQFNFFISKKFCCRRKKNWVFENDRLFEIFGLDSFHWKPELVPGDNEARDGTSLVFLSLSLSLAQAYNSIPRAYLVRY